MCCSVDPGGHLGKRTRLPRIAAQVLESWPPPCGEETRLAFLPTGYPRVGVFGLSGILLLEDTLPLFRGTKSCGRASLNLS